MPDLLTVEGLGAGYGAVQVLRDVSLGLTYGIYAVFAALSFVFVLKWVRETKGVELEDMPE